MRDNECALLIEDRILPSQETAPLVCCVLVNWNGWRDTLPCLAALMAQDYPALRVIVVDNASTDDSVARIRAAYPQVTVIEAGGNFGFGAGCNVGARRALQEGAEFVWLLNNDTVAPPDSCRKLVSRAQQEPRAGIIGSVLYYMHDPANVQAWGGGDITVWLGRASHSRVPFPLGPNSYLTFASVLLPREVVLRVGLLYEGFFMYWEDADLALRVTRAGYTLAVAEDTAILHREGGSGGEASPLMHRFTITSGLIFLRRHATLPAVSMAVFLATKLGIRLLRGEWKNAQAVLLAVKDYRALRHEVYRETV